MSNTRKLAELKVLLDEQDDDCRVLSDDLLLKLLKQARGRVRRAAYLGALRKAEPNAIRLPDGVALESTLEHWLTLAQSFRCSQGGAIRRADESPPRRRAPVGRCYGGRPGIHP